MRSVKTIVGMIGCDRFFAAKASLCNGPTNLVCMVSGPTRVGFALAIGGQVSLKHVRQNLFRDNGLRRFMRFKTSALALVCETDFGGVHAN